MNMSPASRGRGLKRDVAAAEGFSVTVARFARAWIETIDCEGRDRQPSPRRRPLRAGVD